MRLHSVFFALSFLTLVACGGSVAPVDGSGSKPSPSPAASSPGGGGTGTGGGGGVTTPSNPPSPITHPTMAPAWESTASGCGGFFVYVPSADEKEFLVMTGDSKALGLAKVGDSYTQNLGAPTETRVYVDVYPNAGGGENYCNDAPSRSTPKKSATLPATAGTMTVTVSSVDASNGQYTVTISISGVEVSDGSTTTIIPDATYANVIVGWYAG